MVAEHVPKITLCYEACMAPHEACPPSPILSLSDGAKYRTTFGFGKKMECSLNRRRLEEEEEFEPEWDAD